MLAREIILDPLFTPKFFEFKEEKELDVKLSFAVPKNAGELPSFLKYKQEENIDDSLKQSKAFKEGFAYIVDKLSSWCKKENIDDKNAFTRFKDNYLNYTGSDKEKNKLDFQIYNQGIASLAGIAEQSSNNDISLDDRKSIMAELIKGLNVCGPGSLTNIVNAYLDLMSLSNMSIYWMRMRRKIAEQVVLDLLKTKRIYTGLEVHYVNGVLNRFGDALSIRMVEDGYVLNCDVAILDDLMHKFPAAIESKLTLFTVIEYVTKDSALTNLKAQFESVSNTIYAENDNKLQRFLKRFGKELADTNFYSQLNDIINLYGELEDKIAIDWAAYNKIYLSLYSRMIQAGLVIAKESFEVFNTDVTRFYVPGQPVMLSYVRIAGEKRIPFISYVVNKLVLVDKNPLLTDKDALAVAVCNNKYITQSDRFNIALGLADYLNSTIVELEKLEHDKNLFNYMIMLLRRKDNSVQRDNAYDIFYRLPKSRRMLFMGYFSKRLLLETNDDLYLLLVGLPVDQCVEFIKTIPEDYLKKMMSIKCLAYLASTLSEDLRVKYIEDHIQHYGLKIHNSTDIVDIISVLPLDMRVPFVEYFIGNRIDRATTTSVDLARIVSSFPEKSRIEFILSLEGKYPLKTFLLEVKDVKAFDKILKLWPIDHRMEFIERFGKRIDLVNIIKNIADMDHIKSFIPENKRDSFTEFMVKINVDLILSYNYQNSWIVSYMKSNELCKLILDDQDNYQRQKFLNSCIKNLTHILNDRKELIVLLDKLKEGRNEYGITSDIQFIENHKDELSCSIKDSGTLFAVIDRVRNNHATSYELPYHLIRESIRAHPVEIIQSCRLSDKE